MTAALLLPPITWGLALLGVLPRALTLPEAGLPLLLADYPRYLSPSLDFTRVGDYKIRAFRDILQFYYGHEAQQL